jgi:hypothetical protein
MYAALDSSLTSAVIEEDALKAIRGELRTSAQALQRGVEAWTQTTTGMPPSREYVDASRRLYAHLAQITTRSATDTMPELTYQALLRGAHEVAWLTALVTPQAPRLLQSEVLFIHARHARTDTRRLHDVINGRMAVASVEDVPAVTSHPWLAERSATLTARALPPAVAVTKAPLPGCITAEM